jgi:hypothetical protein
MDVGQWFGGIPATFNAAIQVGGLRAGEELYAWAQQQPDFHRKFVESAFGRLTQKYEEICSDDNSPGPLLTWFSRHFPLDPRFQGEADDIARDIIAKAAQLDAPATLEWLDAQSPRLDHDLSDRSYTTLATEWQSVRLDQFIAWALANPEHPQHATIARAGVKALLIRDNPAQARAMAETVRDQESRRQLAALISEAEAKPAKNAAKSP